MYLKNNLHKEIRTYYMITQKILLPDVPIKNLFPGHSVPPQASKSKMLYYDKIF